MRFAVATPAPPSVPAAAAGGGAAECTLGGPLDRKTTPSSTCLQCHDGSKGLNATKGHRYDLEYFVKPGSDLRQDPERFNGAVVLAGGKVTCLTCHDSGSKLLYHLAAPTGGEVDKRLCVACHVY